jgi:hypothetical protein
VQDRQLVSAEETQFGFELVRVARVLGQQEHWRVALARILGDREGSACTDQAAPGNALVGRGLSGNE